MKQKIELYAEEVKNRLIKTVPAEHLVKRGVELTHICKELKYNFIDGESVPLSVDCNIKGSIQGSKIGWHKWAHSLNSSQTMCINFFKKFFEKEEYEEILIAVLKEAGLEISRDIIKNGVFEYKPDRYESTSLDFYMEMTDGQHISFEVKYTENEFGCISYDKRYKYRYKNTWERNYSRLIKENPYFPQNSKCYKNYECVEYGILKTDCKFCKNCGIFDFYKNYQINRNIVHAKKENDIVAFLTPRENFTLDTDREYIDNFAKRHNTKNIVNLYWEDIIKLAEKHSAKFSDLNNYIVKFRNKYFSRPLTLPADFMYRRGFLEYVEIMTTEDIRTFYQSEILNYPGRPRDTDELYTELIAKWLIDNISLFEKIEPIKRKGDYTSNSRTGEINNPDSNRTEENLAKRLKQQGTVNGNIKILDYQTPLKNVQSDNIGKIDLLVSYDDTIGIMELKTPDSEETMLRCVLECYTYMKVVWKEKLLEQFGQTDAKLKAHPLVALNGAQHKEMMEDRPYLKTLMDLLDVKPIYYYKNEDDYCFVK